MTKPVQSAIVTGAAALAIGSAAFGDIVSPVEKTGEWLRLTVTVIALLIGVYFIWKSKSEAALNDSVKALQTAVEAHKLESAAVTLRLKSVEEERHRLESECIALRTKTDVGEVLKILTLITTTINQQQKKNEATLNEIHKKVMGWKSDRRDSLRGAGERPEQSSRGRSDREGTLRDASDERTAREDSE